MNRQPTRRVVLCMTPLHVLIVCRLAKEFALHYDVAIFLAQVPNEKSRYYASLLKDVADRVDFRVISKYPDGGLQKYVAVWRHRTGFRAWLDSIGDFDEAYAPSSDNDLLYVYANKYADRKLLTYDDGLANINPDSSFARTAPSLKNRFFFWITGAACWPSRLVKRSYAHYTLYAAENHFSRLRRLELMPKRPEAGALRASTRYETILIGSAPEADEPVISSLKDFAKKNKPTWYLPHPRCTRNCEPFGQKLDTQLILEDYVLRRLEQDPSLRLAIVGYESSALINVAGFDRVAAFTLMPDDHVSPVRRIMKNCGVLDISQFREMEAK